MLYSGRQRRSLQDVRVRRGADVGSEHHLVTRTLKLKLRRNGPRKARQQQFDVKWLKEPGAKSTFTLIRNHKFQELADAEKHTPPETNYINTMWEQIRTASHRPAKPAWDADRSRGRGRSQQIPSKRGRALKKKVMDTRSERLKDR